MRQQVYGGQEADCVMNSGEKREQHFNANRIAEGSVESQMRMGFELGEGYGYKVVEEQYNRMVQEAVAAGVPHHLAVNRAQMTMSRACFGVPAEGRRGRWKNCPKRK